MILQLAAAHLRSAGYMSGTNSEDFFQANLILSSLNVTVSREPITFSLASADNKDEGIDNPLIADPDIAGLTPEPASSEDKFPAYKEFQAKNSVDAFYEQDEELTERQKEVIEKLKKKNAQIIFKLASGLSIGQSETQKNKSVNKYFVSPQPRGEGI